MIGFDCKSGGFQSPEYAPVGLTRDQRRRALDRDRRVGREAILEQAIESRRVKLAEREVVRVGKIDDRRVERFLRSLQPDHRVLIDDPNARIIKRMAVQFRKRGKSLAM